MGSPHSAVGWSAVCDCGISWSYSLNFLTASLNIPFLDTSFLSLGPGMYQWGCGPYKICLDNNPRLTLTYYNIIKIL